MINMAKKTKDIKLADFPEEEGENGLKWYGEILTLWSDRDGRGW